MAPHKAVRAVWFLLVGWWLGGGMFVFGLALTPTIVFTAPGYMLMDRAYNFATLKFD